MGLLIAVFGAPRLQRRFGLARTLYGNLAEREQAELDARAGRGEGGAEVAEAAEAAEAGSGPGS